MTGKAESIEDAVNMVTNGGVPAGLVKIWLHGCHCETLQKNGYRGRRRECEAHAWCNGPSPGVGVRFLRPPQQLEAGGNVKARLQRFEDYALDSRIPTENWCSAAVWLLSDGMHEIVRDNGLNRLLSFEQLSTFLKTCFCRPESAVERYLSFQRTKQSVTETEFVFGEAIRSLGRHAAITADEVLRDQFIASSSSYKVIESSCG
uniref:Retrotransposon gag domain-containing protein n=1 Tax=Trichuris muris TaxID=70415 RepID=A0A5S6QK27_TRIMR